MKVQKSRGSERFVALSYMWPHLDDDILKLTTDNLFELETNGFRGLNLLRIISDAIALCRALKEKYLWVDQLCIIQDDEASQLVQIQAMDAIYSSATFTIIAALNNKTNNGLPGCPILPGCPGRPRLPSVLVTSRQYDHRKRKFGARTMGTIVDQSCWNHRGWTFQERLLSRRRLFITEARVVFQCRDGTADEEFICPPRHVGVATGCLRRKHGDAPIPACQTREWRAIPSDQGRYSELLKSDHLEWPDYSRCVELYTRRELSFHSDVLNAFNGVGNVLARGLETKMLFGTPEKYLHFALLWKRRCGKNAPPYRLLHAPDIAPSWSWVSAHHVVEFTGLWTLKGLATRGLIDFYHYDGDSARPERERPLRKIHARDDLDPFEASEKFAFREFTTSIPSELSPDALDAARSLPGSLVFNTATAICQPRVTPHDRQALHNLSNGECVGVIHAGARQLGAEVMVIVICGSDWGILAEKPNCFLEVMLVERDPEKPHVVRRLGLGNVQWQHWPSCNPRWETIVLD